MSERRKRRSGGREWRGAKATAPTSSRRTASAAIPFFGSPRRTALTAGGAILLALFLWALWTYCVPGRPDSRKTWYSVGFTTDNQARPIRLVTSEGGEGPFDLMVVENSADYPLSLLPFPSRPHMQGQDLAAWAQWIATSHQGIIVEPHRTWFLNPKDLDRLPAIHGQTWVAIFFSENPAPVAQGDLPATALPESFSGKFKVHYCPSQLGGDQVSTPQFYRETLMETLQVEACVRGKTFVALADTVLTTSASASQLLQ